MIVQIMKEVLKSFMRLYRDILSIIPKPMSHIIITLIVIGLIEFFIGAAILAYDYVIHKEIDLEGSYFLAYISSGIICAALGLILLAASMFFINIENRKNEKPLYLLKEKYIKEGGSFYINQAAHLWYILVGSFVLYAGIMFLPF